MFWVNVKLENSRLLHSLSDRGCKLMNTTVVFYFFYPCAALTTVLKPEKSQPKSRQFYIYFTSGWIITSAVVLQVNDKKLFIVTDELMRASWADVDMEGVTAEILWWYKFNILLYLNLIPYMIPVPNQQLLRVWMSLLFWMGNWSDLYLLL